VVAAIAGAPQQMVSRCLTKGLVVAIPGTLDQHRAEMATSRLTSTTNHISGGSLKARLERPAGVEHCS